MIFWWGSTVSVSAFSVLRTRTGVGVGALRPPNRRVGRVETVELVSSAVVLLVYLREVVHAQAAQLFRNGALTLKNDKKRKNCSDLKERTIQRRLNES